MEKLEVFKALASSTRIQILDWLKDPESNFGDQEGIDLVEVGVCVSQIKEKLNMTQSTASQHLSILNKAGLVNYKRIGKWTYYKRNEQGIKNLGKVIEKEL
ncbi:ArsR/SmtB family transcription factor [Staphylococcus kloosii]|jgi:DNA-binding transcriptional ArsR family regulator|uniref:ArsR/SmtB family transcription factor n=1 Tax=Staphylococcus kloosii TaxID=29384 RepID=UPI001E64BD05|nr:metalloregulator ArsR/SmtB family transcription factor [Staphylococcus kloosii]MCD8877998.1 metalloregulator ArsR/SmtB family transcription factor [Staphylococcus kloosii]